MSHFELSTNQTGELSSTNPVINFMRSTFGATFMLLVSFLYPIETFAANCNLKAAPVCIDNESCKDVLDPAGHTVTTCLSSAINPPAGALITKSTCWKYNAVYDCRLDPTPNYADTCKSVKDSGNCTNYSELSTICAPNIPLLSSGACALYNVTYQCEVAPGRSYTETKCGTTASCFDEQGKPSFCVGRIDNEKDQSFGKAVTGLEVGRQAGVYMQNKDGNPVETNPDKLFIFAGEPARCSEGVWGITQSCCTPDTKGSNAANAILVDSLIASGWNALAKNYIGSEYVYDSLLDNAVHFFDKGLAAMQTAFHGVSNAATVVATPSLPVGGASAAGTFNVSVLDVTTAIGGAVGGAVVGMKAGQYAASHGANAGWAGTISAIGSTVGSIGGVYAASFATYAGTALYNGAGLVTSLSAGVEGATVLLNPGFLVASLVIAIIMAWTACTPEEMRTQLKLGAGGLCHFVGTQCKPDGFGGCIDIKQKHCCFNSKLARIIQEGAKGGMQAYNKPAVSVSSYQATRICDPNDCGGGTTTCKNYCGPGNNNQFTCDAGHTFLTGNSRTGGTCQPTAEKPKYVCPAGTSLNGTTCVGRTYVAGQIGDWGTPDNPNCGGISVSDIQKLDFSKIDLGEFAGDIVARTNVDGTAEAAKAANMTQGFMDANSADPTATDGLLVAGSTGGLPPPIIPDQDRSLANPTVPAMDACTVAFAVTAITPNGDQTTGEFTVSNCNPGATITWNYQGNCPNAPLTSMDQTSPNVRNSTVDTTGTAKFTITLPGTCFSAAGNSIQNGWRGFVSLPPHGIIGVIDAIWQ